MENATLQVIDGKFYQTARAYIVEYPSDMPREMASEFKKEDLNPSFLWIAGRYVQAGQANKNGHYWTLDDLHSGESSIKFTPMNALHEYQRPIGTLVETKIVSREDRSAGSDGLLPEIQALGVMWAANFPKLAEKVKAAHAANELWYSMECVAEKKQCLECSEIYPYSAAAHETCEHLAASASAPRRFINPIFVGGALIFPPKSPAWPDADITEVAKLTEAFAHREQGGDLELSAESWERVMSLVAGSV
jgi:hypothetical protein